VQQDNSELQRLLECIAPSNTSRNRLLPKAKRKKEEKAIRDLKKFIKPVDGNVESLRQRECALRELAGKLGELEPISQQTAMRLLTRYLHPKSLIGHPKHKVPPSVLQAVEKGQLEQIASGEARVEIYKNLFRQPNLTTLSVVNAALLAAVDANNRRIIEDPDIAADLLGTVLSSVCKHMRDVFANAPNSIYWTQELQPWEDLHVQKRLERQVKEFISSDEVLQKEGATAATPGKRFLQKQMDRTKGWLFPENFGREVLPEY